jgi:putative hydrolase of the HAD superfamily
MVKFDSILFDLDGTLYSARFGLEKKVNRRVNEYIAEYLRLPLEEAWDLRKRRIADGGYGTTIEWLTAEENMDPSRLDDYFAFIHPEGEDAELVPDPLLRPLLLSCSRVCRMAILTNAPEAHARRILKKLEIEDLFPSIFDIRSNGLKGKPHREAFFRALDGLKSSPGRCLFVDDVRVYVDGYRAIGGTGVFLDEFDENPEYPPPRIRTIEELAGIVGIKDGAL